MYLWSHSQNGVAARRRRDIGTGRFAILYDMIFMDIRGQDQGHQAPNDAKMADLKNHFIRHF